MSRQVILSTDNSVYTGETWSGDLYAGMIHEDGRPYHTFRTYTVLADGNHMTFRNCTFENNAGVYRDAGQAIALYLDGDDIVLENCTMKGFQDTLFLAPLPEKEIQKDGFLGPKQTLKRTDRTFVFRNCLIEGTVDFIFGGATARFYDCEFRSVGKGWVFAPSTPAHVKEGFTAINCRFTAAEGVEDGSCFIARPWRNYGMVSLVNCELGAHIHPRGWDDWNKKEAHETMRFSEKGSFGPGYVPSERSEYVSVD